MADSAAPRLDTVVVALGRAESGYLIDRHLYSNLVRLDCTGALRPELATRWRAEDGGKSWVFTLGSVTAGAVRDTWDAQRNGGIWPWPAILEVEVLDSARLRVRLDRGYQELPAEFAALRLEVAKGSHVFEFVAAPAAGPVLGIINLDPVTGRGPIIKVEQLRPNVDPRDAMDFPRAGDLRPADVVITSDAPTIAYARSRPEFAVFPVAWSQSYVLLTPMPGSPSSMRPISDATRRGLERDVVPGEVRPASPPFWWDSIPCLATTKAYDPGPRAGPVLAFDGTDPVARALAERLAAVATSRSRTVAMSRSAVDSAVSAGPANAFVLPFPRQRPVSCFAVTQWPEGSRIDPLVDLQTFVIVRRGVPPLLLDGDGTVRFGAAATP